MEETKEFEDFNVEPCETPQQPVGAASANEEESYWQSPVTEDDAEPSATEPVAASAVDVQQLLAEIAALREQNELLMKKFDAKIAQDEHKAGLFDKMYGELQSYKTDLYAKMLKPFILSTISVIDDTNTFIDKLGEGDAEKAEQYLRSLPEDLADILATNGVVMYEDDSEKFNPRTQRAMKQVPTDDPVLDGTIARRLRKGYNWNGVNLRPEYVWIYKFKPAAQPE